MENGGGSHHRDTGILAGSASTTGIPGGTSDQVRDAEIALAAAMQAAAQPSTLLDVVG